MRFRTTGTQRQTARARAVLGLLVLVSLSLAAQPCVAASISPDSATQGAPTHAEAAAEHAAHRQADTYPEVRGDCPHCAFSGHQRCTDAVQCTEFDAMSAESTVKPKDAPASISVAAASAQPWNALPFARESAIDAPADPPAAQPPLIVRYCVYRI